MRKQLALLVLGVASAGCSWTRYDDIVESSPIVLLNRPKQLESGFGSSLTAATVGDEVTLLVGGAPLRTGGAEFMLGTADSPTLDARDTGHCMGSDVPCYFSNTPIALTGADSPGKRRDLCFVDGAGTASQDTGIVVRCSDDVEYVLDLPEDPRGLLEFSIDNSQPTLFRFGADHGTDPALLANADEVQDVWYYPPLSRDLVEIPYPGADNGRWPETQLEKDGTLSNIRNLTIARVGDGRLLAVGIPDLSEVRLYFAPDGTTPSYIGCLGGTPGFGRAFATGPVLPGDSDDELVISDDSIVYVFDGARLATLVPPPADGGCSLGALPEGALVSSFTCGSTKNISGCEKSQFGAALGVGDLDGDGDGEVVVGAPNMTVRHNDGAGAVIMYDVDDPSEFEFMDIAFLSSAEQDDQLGMSIALPDLGDRQVLVAGAPGNGKVALFYCPSIPMSAETGPRCQ